MSRPAHIPTASTRRQTLVMVSYGLTLRQVAEVLEIDCRTLAKHYGNEISVGRERAAGMILADTLDTISHTISISNNRGRKPSVGLARQPGGRAPAGLPCAPSLERV